MKGVYDSVIVRFAGRVQAPVLQLYGLYVLLHGHYSPGGGFQAGAALAASFLIPRLTEGPASYRGLTPRMATHLAIWGVVLYATIGWLSWGLGGAGFLDYGGLEALPWPMPEGAATRAWGTLGIEVGVTMTVTGVLVMLFDDLLGDTARGADDEATG